jgi:hypothetical protein
VQDTLKLKAKDPSLVKASILAMTSSAQPLPNQTWRSYYFVGNKRVAMRVQEGSWSNEISYFLSDHLGSTSMTVDSNGTKII